MMTKNLLKFLLHLLGPILVFTMATSPAILTAAAPANPGQPQAVEGGVTSSPSRDSLAPPPPDGNPSAIAPANRVNNPIRVPQDQPTIQAGIDAAQDGDLVLVSTGTYTEQLTLSGKTITLASKFYTTGDGSLIDQTVIDGQGGTVITVDASVGPETKIVGFTIQNGLDGISAHAELEILNNHFTGNGDALDYEGGGGICRDNIFEHNTDDGVDLDGAAAVVIEDNIIRDNHDDGIEIRLHAYSGPTLEIVVRNNIISGNLEDGIQLIDYPDLSDRVFFIAHNLILNNAQVGLGLMDDGVSNEDFRAASIPERIHLFNNTFVGNPYAVTGGDNLIALNNLFVDASTVAIKAIDGGSIVAYSLFWNNGAHSQVSNLDTGTTLVADPLLDGAAQLLLASPAIDAGTAQYVLDSGETVLDLPASAYYGAAPDLGAFESNILGDNHPPAVDAGPNQTITLPASARLDGAVTDDGLPDPPGVLTTTWSVVSTPGVVTFTNASAVATTASFSDPGAYVLRLSADDGDLTASDEVTVTVDPTVPLTFEVRVAASSDDAEERATGRVSLTSSDLELVFDGSDQAVGMRFNGVAITQGTTIVQAYVQFQVDEAHTDPITLTIQGQAHDDAPTFDSANGNITRRARTAAAVAWSPPPWTTAGAAGADQRTPDVAAIIQEIVDRPGWTSGNSLVVIITGTDNGNGKRTAESYDGVAAAAPLLHVEYRTGPLSPAPAATIGAPADGAIFYQGEGITFTGSASDPQDGDVTASLVWQSSIDGPIGSGGAFSRSDLSLGAHTITATATDSDGLSGFANVNISVYSAAPVLVGAGDIAGCGSEKDLETSLLLDTITGTVFTLGDNVYPDGTELEFSNCYDPTWGRHKARTRPAAGNHDYHVPGAAGYFNYFGAAAGEAGKGYYSYDVGAWHIVVLNSECGEVGGCGSDSVQGQWLQADLAANPTTCTLAYGHKPRFSSGKHGSNATLQDFWQLLYDAGADVVLSGHDHTYERFAPQDPGGTADPGRGMRQFVVGTGGKSLYTFGTPEPNSEVRQSTTHGVLKLTLHPTSYDWEFIPIAGQTFTDSGSAACVVVEPSAPRAP